MHLARAHEGTEVFSATRRSTTKIAPENCRLRVGELAATRRAYARSAEEFLAWCASMGVSSIAGVRPVHAATWIEAATREPAAPSGAHLFDWLVNGQVVPVNPAHSVRGPRHIVTARQTPLLDPAEARALLDSIAVSTLRGRKKYPVQMRRELAPRGRGSVPRSQSGFTPR
jgi:site-specific recombinase XerC